MDEMENATYIHQEEGFGHHQMASLAELRRDGLLTDVALTSSFSDSASSLSGQTSVPAHRCVLAASSEYFRARFKECWASDENEALVLDVPADVLDGFVDYFYTGRIAIDGDNVADLLNAASLCLLPKLVEACIKFMSTYLDPENCMQVRQLAVSFGLNHLVRSVDNFVCENFEFVTGDQESSLMEMEATDLHQILLSDDLCVQNEESVFKFVANWLDNRNVTICSTNQDKPSNSVKVTASNTEEELEKQVWENVTKTELRSSQQLQPDLGGGGGGGECIVSLLWNTVRFPMLSNTFLTNVVKKSHHWHNISQVVGQFQQEHHLAAADRLINSNEGGAEAGVATENTTAKVSSVPSSWSRSFRSRSKVNDMVVTHCDGSPFLEYFNTEDQDKWQPLVKLPPGCGTEHLSIASHRGQVFVVGTCQEDEGVAREHGARTTSSCHIFNLETQEWKIGPSLNQERWFHGLIRVDTTLYAVGGCGQLNSMESLELTSRAAQNFDESRATWRPMPSFGVRRHLPGVCAHDGQIWVVGGSDDQWIASAVVEVFEPGGPAGSVDVGGGWFRMPDLNVPRVHPALVSVVDDLDDPGSSAIYVIGGRNSKKVELKSVERFNRHSNAWELQEQGLKHKRWSCAAVPYKDGSIVVIGGKGKFSGNSVEVFSPKLNKFTLATHGPSTPDRAYSATIITGGMATKRKQIR